MAEILMISKFMLSIFRGQILIWSLFGLLNVDDVKLLMINNSAMHLAIVLKLGTLLHYGPRRSGNFENTLPV